jgi:hypothetical protein
MIEVDPAYGHQPARLRLPNGLCYYAAIKLRPFSYTSCSGDMEEEKVGISYRTNCPVTVMPLSRVTVIG